MSDLLDIIHRRGEQYDPVTQTGTVLHLLTGVSEMGRIGATIIDDTAELVRARYDRVVAVFDEEAAALGP